MNGRMRRFFDEQLAYLNAGNAKGLVEDHYHPDASLITFDRVTTGRDALLALFEAYIKRMGFFQVRTDKFQATENGISAEADLQSRNQQGLTMCSFCGKGKSLITLPV